MVEGSWQLNHPIVGGRLEQKCRDALRSGETPLEKAIDRMRSRLFGDLEPNGQPALIERYPGRVGQRSLAAPSDQEEAPRGKASNQDSLAPWSHEHFPPLA